MGYLLLGKISKPKGLKGEVKVFSHTDFAFLRYQTGNTVYYREKDEYHPLVVASFYHYAEFDVVSFKDYQDIKLVNSLIGKELYVKKEDAKLPDGYYHLSDLVGLKVKDNDHIVGEVKAVITLPVHYLLRCESLDHHQFDIPFVEAVILGVNLKAGMITVKLIEGML
ncbi:MAG: ribosome maturation factor RimM [Bacilli bacterium]|nr:ribosome maturation factor RimM [Bacilli bacterium]